MRKFGLIGGTSWHSTVEYYKNINTAVNQYFGNNTNPPLIVYTLNQAQVHQYQKEGRWADIADLLMEATHSLEKGGVEGVMLCANTPHKVYDQVSEKVNLPILHIGDAIVEEIKAQNISKVCFIGTKFTMEEPFLTDRISSQGAEVLVPEEADIIKELHRIIHQELTFGKIEAPSKKFVLDTLKTMLDKGAEGVILGCTEFPLMISETDLACPIFDTTRIHSQAAVNFILTSDLNLKDGK